MVHHFKLKFIVRDNIWWAFTILLEKDEVKNKVMICCVYDLKKSCRL